MAAGLEGIKNKMEAPASIDVDLRTMSLDKSKELGIDTLPSSLGEAIEAFEGDSFIQDVLGEHMTQTYLEAKKKEWMKYNHQVSLWEVDEYLKRI